MPMSRIINKKDKKSFYKPTQQPLHDDAYYMAMALTMAKRSAQRSEVPVGAVLVRGNEIIAKAGNTRESRLDPCGHAEINVLRKAAKKLGGWNLHHCTLYVTLEPCPMCAGACVNARIERIVYGAADEKGGACGSVVDLTHGFNHTIKAEGGVLAEQSAKLLRDFFKQKRSKIKN